MFVCAFVCVCVCIYIYIYIYIYTHTHAYIPGMMGKLSPFYGNNFAGVLFQVLSIVQLTRVSGVHEKISNMTKFSSPKIWK